MSSIQSSPAQPGNPFLAGPIPALFLRTTLPIVLVTSINGLLTVVDAILLGSFVGADALTAVTLMFPISMLLVAASTMVGIGMASILGRTLGGGDIAGARRVFVGAHGLSLALCAALIALFAFFGGAVVSWAAGGEGDLADMGRSFLAVSIYTAPLPFLLAVHSDALRAEGRVGFMAMVGVLVSLANIGFNYALIVWAGLGVAGSAWGTAAAQLLALAIVFAYRWQGGARLRLAVADLQHWRHGWTELLALGAPRSLTFIGISLGSAAILFSLHRLNLPDAEATIAAYGVVMRLLTFAFLPLMGMSLGLQAIVGNNFGGRLWARSDASLRLALAVSLAYSVVVEAVLLLGRDGLGSLFVSDPAVAAELGRIMPVYVAAYFCFGPMMMIASYFQAIGDARRAALLSLARTYFFAIPLTLALPLLLGEPGVWLAAPAADLLLVAVTGVVLAQASRTGAGWGLFREKRQPTLA